MGLILRLAPGIALSLLVGAAVVEAQAPNPPSYNIVRHDEDYSYLRDPAQRSDWLDPIKHIPLSDSRPDWYLSFGGELRERFEFFKDTDWDPAKGSNGFLLQRYMLSCDVHLGRRVRFFTNLKSGLEDGRNGGPRPVDEDRLDVHEAFVDLSLDSSARSTLRLGRQELSFGSQRLVSVRSGPNVRQSFDGATLIVRPGSWRLDTFAVKPVETNTGVFDDSPDHARTFWGVYAVGPLRIFPGAGVDLYYLGLDRKKARFDKGTASELRESIGTRIWRRAAPWDYNFEVVYQWGRFASAPIRAWTVASDSGLTLPRARWRPRFGLKADVTSGDKNPTDPTLESFNPLFPRGAYFGENQLIGPVNHMDLHPSIDIRPLPGVTVSPSWLFFWRQSLRDGLYGVPGNLIRSGKGTSARYVGSQPALMAAAAAGRHATIAAVYEYFIAGAFLRESGPGHDVTYFGTWVSYVF
jgi:Alginate export